MNIEPLTPAMLIVCLVATIATVASYLLAAHNAYANSKKIWGIHQLPVGLVLKAHHVVPCGRSVIVWFERSKGDWTAAQNGWWISRGNTCPIIEEGESYEIYDDQFGVRDIRLVEGSREPDQSVKSVNFEA